MREGQPSVSVCVITYNHEGFIRDCLQGICAQSVRSSLEVVIGEDASSDRTLPILLEFAARDDRLRILASTSNKGMAQNFLDTLRECRGRYVALCEGDDYWIDPEKLQRQVEFLDRHPECVLCFHNSFVEYPDGRRGLWRSKAPMGRLTASDLFAEWLLPTASVVFRNPGRDAYPSYLQRATHGDLGLFVFLADTGEMGYVDRVMSVYRRHPGGIMSTFEGLAFSEREIRFLQEMNAWFRHRYERPIRRRVGRLKASVASHLARRGLRAQAVGSLWGAFKALGRPDPVVLLEAVKVLFMVALPARWAARLRLRRRCYGTFGVDVGRDLFGG